MKVLKNFIMSDSLTNNCIVRIDSIIFCQIQEVQIIKDIDGNSLSDKSGFFYLTITLKTGLQFIFKQGNNLTKMNEELRELSEILDSRENT